MFKSRSPKKEECIMPMRCIKFCKKYIEKQQAKNKEKENHENKTR